ncbi:MAG: hypothetical protein Q7U76_12875 [Nitrospirota bacterium]|nr:hypothetical protein [Nitrospirota bacterium]
MCDRLVERLEAITREAVDKLLAQVTPSPLVSAPAAIPFSNAPITKAEFLFLSGNDAIRISDGRLYTSAFGRLVMTQ